MTLLICAVAAIIVTVIRFVYPAFAVKWHLGALALMYASASLMWCVDGFFSLSEGEPFIELVDPVAMADDALLGLWVVVLGLIVWGIVLLVKRSSSTKQGVAA